MNHHLEKNCEGVDAAVFSGDVLYDDDSRAELKDYIGRWTRAIAEHEGAALAAPPGSVGEPVASVRVEGGMMRGATRRPGMASLPDGDHKLYAAGRAVEAALRDAPQQAEGWVMVPVAPTDAMAGRFFDAIEGGGTDWDDTPDDHEDKVEAFAEFSKGYRAMLAATPSAPTAVEPDVPLKWCSYCGEGVTSFCRGKQSPDWDYKCPVLNLPARALKGTP